MAPASAPPATATATAAPPPPEGTEASFSRPAAISSVMSFPLTCDRRSSILSSSASAPTVNHEAIEKSQPIVVH